MKTLKLTFAITIVAVLFGIANIGTAQECSPNPVLATLDTTHVTSPAVIPEVRIMAEYTGETQITVMTLTNVPAGQEIPIDILMPFAGTVTLLPVAFDAQGCPSIPPVPFSTFEVTISTDPVIGNCGLSRR